MLVIPQAWKKQPFYESFRKTKLIFSKLISYKYFVL